MAFEERIDIHSHFLPDFYPTALQATAMANQMGCQQSRYVPDPSTLPNLTKTIIQKWLEDAHLSLMKSLSISKSILSISPGTHLVPGEDHSATALIRRCNDYPSSLAFRHHKEFGFFAFHSLIFPLR
jgi:6-methylsalicylate decarboxylase